jgi:hypothetical protein
MKSYAEDCADILSINSDEEKKLKKKRKQDEKSFRMIGRGNRR